MNIIKTYESAECNAFDVIIDGVVMAYYYEHFVDPEGEKLETPVFEIYYDKDEYDDFTSSMVTEDFDEVDDIINSLYN